LDNYRLIIAIVTIITMLITARSIVVATFIM